MKKFLIVVICLIPILLILALNGASALVAIRTPDNPTQIEVRDKYNKVIGADDVVELDLSHDDDFIIINIYPEITKNKKINSPEIVKGSAGELRLEHIKGTNRYAIVPLRAGYLELIISAEANIEIKTTVSFLIKTNRVSELSILDAQRNTLSVSGISSERMNKLSGEYKLDYSVIPFSALDYISTRWEVAPYGAVEILANGHIVINDRIKVAVSLSVTGKDGVSLRTSTNIDFSNAIVKRTLVHTKDVVDIEWIRENIVFDEFKTSAVITKLEGSKYKVEANGDSVEVSVYDNIQDEIYFSDGIKKVYTNTSVPRLTLATIFDAKDIDLDDYSSDYYSKVRFSSSDEDIAKVHEYKGMLQLNKMGTCTITAVIADKECKKTIEVREAREHFNLRHEYMDQFRGIRQDRVWGTKFIVGGEPTKIVDGKTQNVDWQTRFDKMEVGDTYDFFVKGDNGEFDIIWEYDNEGVIEVKRQYPVGQKNDIKIKFLESGLGQSVTLSAYMSIDGKYKIQHLKKSFTFKIINRPNAINVVDSIQCHKAFTLRALDMVFQDDIIHDSSTYGDRMSIYANIWGNGFRVSEVIGDNVNTSVAIICYYGEDGRNKVIEKDANDKVIIDDLTIMPIVSLVDHNTPLAVGSGILVKDFLKTPIELRYLQVKNTNIGIEVRKVSKFTLEGSIIGDNRFIGLIRYKDWDESIDNDVFVLKNTIFTNTLGPSIMFLFDDLNVAAKTQGKNILPEVRFEGNVRFFNWQSRKQLNTLIDVILAQYFPDDDSLEGLKRIVAPFWEKIMKDRRWDNMFMWHKGTEYASMGMMTYGLTAKNDLNKLQLGDKYAVKAIPLMNKDTETYLLAFKIVVSVATNHSIEDFYDSHLIGYDFSKGKPEVMPLEPVPSSYAMFETLKGDKVADYA